MYNKTVIIIAHRLSTIRSANKIIVMERGCLIEQGNHEELLRRKGKYCDMWNMYNKSLDWKIHSKVEVSANA
jgi:ATP-binding cassette subfamily B protein